MTNERLGKLAEFLGGIVLNFFQALRGFLLTCLGADGLYTSADLMDAFRRGYAAKAVEEAEAIFRGDT